MYFMYSLPFPILFFCLSLFLPPSSCFTSLCYTADGRCILAGGRSKFICIYDVTHQVLLKKFQISRNRAFDGMKVQCCIRGALTDTHTCTPVTQLMCTISLLVNIKPIYIITKLTVQRNYKTIIGRSVQQLW